MLLKNERKKNSVRKISRLLQSNTRDLYLIIELYNVTICGIVVPSSLCDQRLNNIIKNTFSVQISGIRIVIPVIMSSMSVPVICLCLYLCVCLCLCPCPCFHPCPCPCPQLSSESRAQQRTMDSLIQIQASIKTLRQIREAQANQNNGKIKSGHLTRDYIVTVYILLYLYS